MAKNYNKIIVSFLALFIVVLIFSPVILATGNNVALLKTSDKNMTIYVENLKDTFKFAVTETNQKPDKLSVSSVDTNGDNVAVFDFSKFSSNELYLHLVDSKNNESVIKFNLNDNIAFEKINDMNNITKKIKVVSDKVKVEEKDINGVDQKVTVGKAVITDDKEKDYTYSLLKVSDKNDAFKIVELVKKINKFNFFTDTYTKISTYSELENLYNKLHKELNFAPVDNFEVLQPKESQEGDKYILLLKQLNNDEIIKEDMQILTCFREYDEGVGQKVFVENVMKAVKLPVTGDNLMILIAALVLILILVVLIVMKKKVNNNEKK